MTARQITDPGLGTRTSRPGKRIINHNGTFNVIRRGQHFDPKDIYLHLVNMSWKKFLLITVLFYIAVNLLFTGIYMMVGLDRLHGLPDGSYGERVLYALFFSVQTITTVGYGVIAPEGMAANTVAAIEATLGWFNFALASGLLYGRFSRPSAKVVYSRNMIVAPLNGLNTLQARVANRRSNNMIDVEARMLLILTEKNHQGEYQRRFYGLKLEISQTQFFPLSWTIVHPIDDNSPLSGKTAEDLSQLHAEVIVSLKGHDESYNQTVHSRFSYRFDEIIWNARFKRAFHMNSDGSTMLDLNMIDAIEHAEHVSDTHTKNNLSRS